MFAKKYIPHLSIYLAALSIGAMDMDYNTHQQHISLQQVIALPEVDFQKCLDQTPFETLRASATHTHEYKKLLTLFVSHQVCTDHVSNVVRSISVNPQGTYFISDAVGFSSRWRAHIWNVSSREHMYTLAGHDGNCTVAAWSPTGTEFATGSSDKTIRIWNAATGTCKHTLRGHTGAIESLAWNALGTAIASGSRDKTARLWDSSSGDPIAILTEESPDLLYGALDTVGSISWSPDGQYIATTSPDSRVVRIWNVKSATIIRTLFVYTVSVTNFLYPPKTISTYWSPDSQYLATASSDRAIHIWDVNTGRCLHSITDQAYPLSAAYWISGEGYAHLTGEPFVVWNPDSIHIAFIRYDEGIHKLHVFNTRTGYLFYEVAQSVITAAWSPTGSYLGCTDAYGQLYIFQAQTNFSEKYRLSTTKSSVITKQHPLELRWLSDTSLLWVDGGTRIHLLDSAFLVYDIPLTMQQLVALARLLYHQTELSPLLEQPWYKRVAATVDTRLINALLKHLKQKYPETETS